MIRRCNGADPYLTGENGLPCTCGATFDDGERLVTWPHERAMLTDEQVAALCAWFGELPS